MSTDNVFSAHPDETDPTEGFSAAQKAAADLRIAAQERGAELKEAAVGKAETIRENATEKFHALKNTATDQATQLKEAATVKLQDSKVRAQELHRNVETYVRENPTRSVLTAAGVGFLLGLICRR